MTSREEKRRPRIALRPHESALTFPQQGRMNDVVVEDVETFRAELMTGNALWLCCQFHNGERVTFNVRAVKDGRRAKLIFDVAEMPGEWDDIDAGFKEAGIGHG